MRHETQAARMERLLRTLPPAVRGMGFGDPDDAQYAHASDVVAWAISEIDRLREERRWVPVRERLPEVGVEVFVGCFNKRGTPLFHAVAKWQRAPSGLCVWEDEDCVIHHPTHWRPLPAPPSEGEVDG